MSYGAEASTGELVALVPEFWDNEIEKFRYEKSVMLNRVTTKTGKIKGYGDTLRMFIKGRYTATAVTESTGAFTVQEYTPTEVDLLIDQHFVVAIETVNRATKQSIWDPKSSVADEATSAFAVEYDRDLLALGSTIGTIGTVANPKVFNLEMARAMYIRLAKRNIPRSELSFVLPVEGIYDGLYKQVEVTDASKIGLPKSVLSTGYIMPLLGVPVYETNLAQKPTGAANSTALQALLFHKSAYAIGMQLNNHYEEASNLSAGRLAKTVAIDSLWGTIRFRGDHAVVGLVKEYIETQEDQ